MNNNQHVSDADLDADLEIRATAVANRIDWCERFEKATKTFYEATTDEMEDVSIKELDSMIKQYPATPQDKMKCIAQFHDELTSVQWLRSVRIAVMAQAIDWCERVAAQYHLEDEGTNVLYIEDARQFLHLTPSPTAWDADEITKWLAEHFTTKYHLTVVALGLTEEEDEAYFLHRFETVGALYPYRVA